MPENRPWTLEELTSAYPGAGKRDPMGDSLETHGAWESHHVCENHLCPC